MHHVISNELLKKLLINYPTPFYIYNKKTLINNIVEIKNAFPIKEFQLLFATMANDHPEFLKILKENNVGACINSIKHLDIVLNCGFTKEGIQFTSTGLSLEELKILNNRNITVNFDSLNQLRQWFNLGIKNKAGVRINTASLMPNSISFDRLGNDKNEIPRILNLTKEYGGIINGLHIYMGTNFKRHNQMLEYLEIFFELASRISTLEYINIGGGIGVNYLNDNEDFDINAYGNNVAILTKRLSTSLQKEIKLVFEPGRRLAASSGLFVTKVTDIKYLNQTRYVVVDASIAVFPRPFHHPESLHKTILPFNNGNTSLENTVIVGKTTFSKDIMSKTSLPKNLKEGDIIVFEQAGAYSDSMRSKFLGQYDPANIFINE
jgi:diaminopimelate decarboxylase